MAIQVDPIIVRKLGEFSRRRRALIAWRGACAFACSLLIALCIVVLLDWAFFLTEAARWSLSLTAYATAALVVWLTSLRLIARVPSAAQLARLLESAQPELREDLISAVELGDPTSARFWDSDQFRRLLQHNVAHRLDDLNVRQLLPQRLIKRWVIAAVVVVATCGLLLTLPGAHFGQRLARALMPMADIERISQTRISIVAPQPANLAVAEGETVEIVVELAGPARDDNVLLETFRADNKQQQTMMVRAKEGERRFTGMLKVGSDQVQYRICANDARTRKHLIVSRTRPRVVSFHKTYHYPDYTRTAAKTVVEKSGDLAAVEGTRVDLMLETDQRLTLAHLKIDTGGEPVTIALTPELNADGTISNRVRGSVSLENSGSFRVHLVAAETGFTNKFAPDYVLRAEPDNPPRIRVIEPSQYVFVPQDGIISLRGQAKDDWAIQKIEQRVRINDGDWNSAATVEIQQIVEQQEFQHDWDLYPLKLRAGDEVLTKLVAFDRKGNAGESRVVKVLISDRGFDPKRLAWLEATRITLESLHELSAAAGQLKAAIDTAESKSDQAGVTPLEKQQMLSKVYQAIQSFDDSANASLDRLQSATRLASPGRESRDLVLTGRVVGRALSTGTTTIRHLLAKNADDTDTQHRSLQSAQEISNSIDEQWTKSVNAFEPLLLSSHYAVIADNLTNMSKQLERSLAKENVDVANSTPHKRLSRQLKADAGQLQVLEDLLANLGQHDDVNDKTTIEQLKKHIAEGKLLTRQAAEADQDQSLVVKAERLKQDLENIEDRLLTLIRERSSATRSSRESLIIQAGSMHELATEVADNAGRYSALKGRIGAQAARGELDSLEQDAEEAKVVRRRTAQAYQVVTTQLKARAFLEQARGDSSGQFVADVSRAWRAIDAQRRQSEQGGDAEAEAVENLQQIASAVHVISASHRLDDLTVGVRRLSQFEREQSDEQGEGRVQQASAMLHRSPQGHSLVKPSIDWLWVETQFRALDEQLDGQSINDKAHHLVGAARLSPLYQKIQMEMEARPLRARVMKPVAAELDSLSTDLDQVKRLLGPSLYEARALLARLSPRLSDILADAADAARELEQATGELSEDPLPAEEGEADVREQQKRMEVLTEEVEQVRAALLQDANEQDVFEEEGRQRMRDIDDSLAILNDRSNRAEAALRRAATIPEERERLAALAEAVREQRELADRLEQLAQHFDQLEDGEPSPTRQALRDAEEELGVRQELEAQHQQLEELARLAQSNPERALADLENQLRDSPQLQRALSELNRETLEDAQENLHAAAERQRQIIEQLERLVRERPEVPERVQPEEQLSELQRDIERLANEQVALAAAAAGDEQTAADRNQNDRVEQPGGRQEQAAQQNEVAEALARTQQQLERLANRAPEDAREASARQRARETAELAESLRASQQQLQQAAELADGQNGNENQPQAVSAEEAEQATQRAAALAEQAAEQAEQANRQSQQAARAARQAEGQNEVRAAAQQASRHAAQAATRAEQARVAARQVELSAEQAARADADPEQAENLERIVREAVQDANSAAEQARQAVEAAGEAVDQLAQADSPSPDDNPAENRSEQLAQQALREAANAAQQAQRAAQAAQRSRQAERPGDRNSDVASNPEAPSQEQLAEAQRAAQDLAQQAAANAAEAAADALEQAEAAAEAVAGAAQANDEPERLRREQQAERAAREAAQAAEQANAANRQAQAAEQLARQPQLAQQQAEQSARRAEELAERAEQLARELDQQAAIEQLATEQPEVAEALEQAARDLARAERNQERLGDQEQSQTLGDIAEATESASESAAAATEQLAANAPEQAGQPATESERGAAEQAERLAELLESGTSEPSAAEGEQGGESAGEEAGQPAPGEPGGSESTPSEGAEPSSSEAAGSEPGGAEPGTNEPGGSEPGNPSGSESSPGAEPASTPGQGSENGTPTSQPRIAPQVAAQLARALDQLDQQVFGQEAAASAPSQPESSDGGQASGEPGSQSTTSTTGLPSQGNSEQSSGNESGSQASNQPSSPAGQDSQPGNSAGEPGSPSESQSSGSQSALQALAAAAQAQARSMAAARAERSQQSNSPTGSGYASLSEGASVTDNAARAEALPDLKSLKRGDWGNLPPQLARDLLEGSRESVAPEFRKKVESYFRAIAERARARKGNRK